MIEAKDFKEIKMLGSIGTGELMIIMFVILLLFGAKRLPELARSVGKSMAEFKHAVNSATDDIRQELRKPEA
jgi:sec-independent protein translocase protein TatA